MKKPECKIIEYSDHPYSENEHDIIRNSRRWRWLKAKAILRDRGCIVCDSIQISELNLHHRYYQENRAIDDYDIDDVTLLCGECHALIHRGIFPQGEPYHPNSKDPTCLTDEDFKKYEEESKGEAPPPYKLGATNPSQSKYQKKYFHKRRPWKKKRWKSSWKKR